MQEITSSSQLDTFVQSQPENVLTVVNISSNATPCVRVFPAVLALAKNFVGYAAFARLLYETSDETQSLANQLRVREVRPLLALATGLFQRLTHLLMQSTALRAGWQRRLLQVLSTMPYSRLSDLSMCSVFRLDRPGTCLHSDSWLDGWGAIHLSVISRM